MLSVYYTKSEHLAKKIPENIQFIDLLNVIIEQELEKIRTARYEINCGLAEEEQIRLREKFERICEKFNDEGLVV